MSVLAGPEGPLYDPLDTIAVRVEPWQKLWHHDGQRRDEALVGGLGVGLGGHDVLERLRVRRRHTHCP